MSPDGFLFGLIKAFFLLTHIHDGGVFNGTSSCSYESDGNHNAKRPFTIIVEGAIGAGKSTLVDVFENYKGIMTIQEPVEKWRDVNGTNLLDLLINDGRRWAGAFQMESTLTRLQDALKDPVDSRGGKASIRIIERSIYSERYCFLQWMMGNNGISAPEGALMDGWFKFASKHLKEKIKPDLIGIWGGRSKIF